jgi:hypothetical protein
MIKETPMAFTLDPEVAEALEPMAAAMADVVPPPVGDVRSRRPVLEAVMAQTAAAQPMPTDVKATDFHTTAIDGAHILLPCPPAISRSASWTSSATRISTTPTVSAVPV